MTCLELGMAPHVGAQGVDRGFEVSRGATQPDLRQAFFEVSIDCLGFALNLAVLLLGFVNARLQVAEPLPVENGLPGGGKKFLGRGKSRAGHRLLHLPLGGLRLLTEAIQAEIEVLQILFRLPRDASGFRGHRQKNCAQQGQGSGNGEPEGRQSGSRPCGGGAQGAQQRQRRQGNGAPRFAHNAGMIRPALGDHLGQHHALLRCRSFLFRGLTRFAFPIDAVVLENRVQRIELAHQRSGFLEQAIRSALEVISLPRQAEIVHEPLGDPLRLDARLQRAVGSELAEFRFKLLAPGQGILLQAADLFEAPGDIVAIRNEPVQVIQPVHREFRVSFQRFDFSCQVADFVVDLLERAHTQLCISPAGVDHAPPGSLQILLQSLDLTAEPDALLDPGPAMPALRFQLIALLPEFLEAVERLLVGPGGSAFRTDGFDRFLQLDEAEPHGELLIAGMGEVGDPVAESFPVPELRGFALPDHGNRLEQLLGQAQVGGGEKDVAVAQRFVLARDVLAARGADLEPAVVAAEGPIDFEFASVGQLTPERAAVIGGAPRLERFHPRIPGGAAP